MIMKKIAVLLCLLLTLTTVLQGCHGVKEQSSQSNPIVTEYKNKDDIDYARLLASSNQQMNPGDGILNKIATDYPSEKKDYTVMIYMTGSNLESQLGNATKDMLEVIDSGIDYSKNNVLIYTGGSQRWIGAVPCDKNSVFDMARPAEEQIVAQTKNNANMGAAETLTEFLTFSYENYPSEHYALILWDHGGGPLWGYGSDELYNSDTLLLEEMKLALDDSPFSSKGRLDWVGFDACLMGAYECMSLWSNYADYFVGSEELEPGQGWDYHFLRILNETTDPEEVTRYIVDTYSKFYEDTKSDLYNPDVTLSSVNIKNIKKLEHALNELSSHMEKELKHGAYSEIQKLRSKSKSFGFLEGAKGQEPYSYDLVDLGNFCENISERYPDDAQELQDIMESMIVESYSNIEGCSGITFYYPYQNKGQYSQMADIYNNIAQNSSYGRFLNTLATEWYDQKGRDWNLGEMTYDEENHEYILQLSEDQLANMNGAYYTVFRRMDYKYSPILKRYAITADENGVLHVPADPEILAISSDTGELCEWPTTQVESSQGREVYRTEHTRLVSDDLYNGTYQSYSSKLVDITVTIQKDQDSGEFHIQNILSLDKDAVMSGKNTIDVNHYEGIYSYYHNYHPIHDETGRMKPFSEWLDSHYSYTIDITLDKNFGFEARNCSEFNNNFCIQLEIEDTRGEFYATELSEVVPGNNYQTVKETTEKGDLTYIVTEEEVYVSNYTGSDLELTIPDHIQGKPVTSILANTFNGSQITHIQLPETLETIGNAAFAFTPLAEINLPSSLKAIGSQAFYENGLTKIKIPNGVETIGKAAFDRCYLLEEIDLPSSLLSLGAGFLKECDNLQSITIAGQANGSSEGCVLKDHVAFSGDGSQLLAYPASMEGSYQIPEGVKSVEYGAFSKAKITKVTMPDSLEIISNLAFAGCVNLEPPELPENLKEIGYLAFGSFYDQIFFDKPDAPQKEIYIGPKVEYIGEGAFEIFLSRSFRVSEKNPFYASLEGSLCNKEKDTIIAYAMNGIPQIYMPGGIRNFDCSSLRFIKSLDKWETDSDYYVDSLDLYVPDSVERWEDVAEFADDLSDNIVLHISRGSKMDQIIQNYMNEKKEEDPEIQYSYNCDLLQDICEEKTPYGKLTFELYENYAALISYDGTDATVEVPEVVKNHPVLIIGDGTHPIQPFTPTYEERDKNVESKNIQHLILPEGLQEINDKALDQMMNAEVFIPDSVKILGSQSLDCRIQNNHLPSALEYIGNKCIDFGPSDSGSYFTSDGILAIPKGVTHIDPENFSTSYNTIKGFQVEEGNEYFSSKEGMLYDIEGTTLLKAAVQEENADIIIPQGTLSIASNAFQYCNNLEKVTLPEGLLQIEKNAFYGCSSLREIHWNNEIEKIGYRAFYSCESLETITFPESIKVIESQAFERCVNLQEINLPEGIETIEDYGFSGCYSLKKFNLPNSLINLGYNSFDVFNDNSEEEQEAMKEIYLSENLSELESNSVMGMPVENYVVDENNPYYSSVDGMILDKTKSILYYCATFRKGEVHVPEGVSIIWDTAFQQSPFITDLYIPDSVVQIYDNAIYKDYIGTTEEGTLEYSYNATIHCTKGSYAEQYAKNHGIDYVIIDE